MTVFSHPEFDRHEEVAFRHDPDSGLKAIIALHNLNRGPALGGCRMWDYDSEAEALTDALRLSRGMTYKSALADLPYGGGKSVIIGDPRKLKSEALFLAMGHFVESLGGRYTIAEDVGISVGDIETIGLVTDRVAGAVSRGGGDPSPGTAYGVFVGIKAAVAHRLERDDLDGLRVAVQGLGQVGYRLCRYLHEAGAKLVVTDIERERLRRAAAEFGAEIVPADAIYSADAAVFAPCALGAAINDETLERLQATVVAGSANNQLAEPRHGKLLMDRRVLYAPDYVINAGGIVHISHEGPYYDADKAFAHIGRIGDTLREIFERAEAAGQPTSEAADRLAEQRFLPSGRPSSRAA